MIRTELRRLVMLAVALGLLSGCGLKGDLYLEEPSTPASDEATEAAAESDENPAAD